MSAKRNSPAGVKRRRARQERRGRAKTAGRRWTEYQERRARLLRPLDEPV